MDTSSVGCSNRLVDRIGCRFRSACRLHDVIQCDIRWMTQVEVMDIRSKVLFVSRSSRLVARSDSRDAQRSNYGSVQSTTRKVRRRRGGSSTVAENRNRHLRNQLK